MDSVLGQKNEQVRKYVGGIMSIVEIVRHHCISTK